MSAPNGPAVSVCPGASFDLREGKASAPWIAPVGVERERYVSEVLAPRLFDYQKAPGLVPLERWGDLLADLHAPHARMLAAQDRNGHRSIRRSSNSHSGRFTLYCGVRSCSAWPQHSPE